jgi:hypothetical protein
MKSVQFKLSFLSIRLEEANILEEVICFGRSDLFGKS